MDEADEWRGVDLALAAGAAVIVAYGVLVLEWSVFVVIALFWFGARGVFHGALRHVQCRTRRVC